MKQQRLFTVVETGENNIDRTSLFAIVIIVAQPCQQVVTALLVLNNVVDNIVIIVAERLC